MAEMMQNLYLEVTNACLHACTTCPHGTHNRVSVPYFTPINLLCNTVEIAMRNKHVRSVTLSGGEPLMHPDIVRICALLTQMGVQITMLSNLQLLAAKNMGEALYHAAPHMIIVTALHSSDATPHDIITRCPGSHAAAVRSIDMLVSLHMRVILKVILSINTCRCLKDIMTFAYERWGHEVRFNLCGLDLCGANTDTIRSTPVDYSQEGKMIEEALDAAEKNYGELLPRYVNITEYPLCYVDPYFWKLFSSRRNSSHMTAYIKENSFLTADALRVENSCDIHALVCSNCLVAPVCPGFWHSVYRVQGEKCVRPYTPEHNLQ